MNNIEDIIKSLANIYNLVEDLKPSLGDNELEYALNIQTLVENIIYNLRIKEEKNAN